VVAVSLAVVHIHTSFLEAAYHSKSTSDYK
jgi:hypothetical protein